MELSREQPFVRQAVRGTLSDCKASDIHYTLRTVDSRIFYVISGKGEMTAGGKTYSLCRGSTVIFGAGTPYIWNVSEMQFYIINFDYSSEFSHITSTFHPFHEENFPENQKMDCGEISDEPLLNSPIVLQNASSLEPLFRMIVTEYSVGGSYSGSFLSNAVKALIYAILKLATEKERADEEKSTPLVRSVIEYVGENLDKPLTNTDIAEKFHFNASYINRIFKKHTGATLHDYIIEKRINSAAEKLRSEGLSVSEIARLTGFSGVVHFSKAFRKRMGMSPSEYRNM